MNSYQHYMDTIRLTPEEHAALLSALEARAAPRRPSLLPRLAACACGLALLAGLWTLDANGLQPGTPPPARSLLRGRPPPRRC